jgi:putative nucleotidyltransferase with HDIG domain
MTKPKPEAGRGGAAATALAGLLARAGARFGLSRGQYLILGISFAAVFAATAVFSPASPLAAHRALSGFEAGKVAERDLVAERDVVYQDQAETEAALRKAERAVFPVFAVDEAVTRSALSRFSAFREFALGLSGGGKTASAQAAAIRERFPGLLDEDGARAVAAFADRFELLRLCGELLDALLARGIVEIPAQGLERYAPGGIELMAWRGDALVTEDLPAEEAVTLKNWGSFLPDLKAVRGASRAPAEARALLAGFLTANAFFDKDLSEKRLAAARAEVKPAVKRISRGERVVKKGYIVDQAQMEKLRVLGATDPGVDALALGGAGAFLLLCYVAGLVLLGKQISGAGIDGGDFTFLVSSATLFLLIAAAATRAIPQESTLPYAVLLPSALAAILVSILQGQRSAVAFSFALSLALLPLTGLNAIDSAFAFFSSVAATVMARRAEKRIDLVRAAVGLSAFQAFLALVLAALAGKTEGLPAFAFWAAMNGFFCGMLALGFLPLLESALNAATRFRLMELSDLNGPLLKRLLNVAPGTYSHSIMVANLAESACQDIGANALLARVASYYHDIGKMDQPAYFVENQASYNKHVELKPRLSAAIIRNHVKTGVEKARAMRLPREVVDIIAQHHGDGLIAWFYGQAVKEEGSVNPEDFSYPGTPPASRESAVVMLADSVEAASRTLAKPTLAKLGQFVDELIMDKFRQGQLSSSRLSLKDLSTINGSFVRILAGHYHSRLEYPKLKEAGAPQRESAAQRDPAPQPAPGARPPEGRPAAEPAPPEDSEAGRDAE